MEVGKESKEKEGEEKETDLRAKYKQKIKYNIFLQIYPQLISYYIKILFK